jgi:hypothetical protein
MFGLVDRREYLRSILLLVILLVILIGVLPTWPYGSGWGYYLPRCCRHGWLRALTARRECTVTVTEAPMPG